MGWFDDIVSGITGAVDTVVDGVKDVSSSVVDGVVDGVNTVVDEVKDVSSSAEDMAVKAWEATSDEAKDVAAGIESSGYVISDGFVKGANYSAKFIKDGAEYVGESAISAGVYLEQHACNIGVASALSAVFLTLATDGEEELTFASFAALAAQEFVDESIVNTECQGLAAFIANLIHDIPGISKVDKNLIIAVLAYVFKKLITEDRELVIGTCGQFMVGVIMSVITSLVCDGTLPGGFTIKDI